MAESMISYGFQKGDMLIEKNKPGKYMLLLSQGHVIVDLGQKKIPLAKGDVVGEMSLLSCQLSSADVIAETATKAFALNRHAFQGLMVRHGELAAMMESLMHSRVSGNK